jgi:hypothetical protein
MAAESCAALGVRLEITCLAGSLLLLVLPIGANHGPVAWMTNVALPIALIVLLRKPERHLPSRVRRVAPFV